VDVIVGKLVEKRQQRRRGGFLLKLNPSVRVRRGIASLESHRGWWKRKKKKKDIAGKAKGGRGPP